MAMGKVVVGFNQLLDNDYRQVRLYLMIKSVSTVFVLATGDNYRLQSVEVASERTLSWHVDR